MELSEKIRLESVRRHLRLNLQAVESLLGKAHPPRPKSQSANQVRAKAICQDIRQQGGRVSKRQLRSIVVKHRMPFTTVGALYGATYLRSAGSQVSLGKRGLAAISTAKRRQVRKKNRVRIGFSKK